MIARGRLQDLLVRDGVAAVFIDEQVIVLSEVASAALLAVPETGGVSLEQVAEHLVGRFGSPPDLTAVEAARQVVDQLADHRIVTLTQGDL